MKKFNYGKIFLLGFGFFGVSVIWATYNAFVPSIPCKQVQPLTGVDRLFHDIG